jgi:CRP-like cAMP-binding protein
MEQVTLQADQSLFHYGDLVKSAFFPLTAVVSLRCLIEEGKSIEVGQVGHESLIGLPALLGPDIALHTAEVLIPGRAVMIRTESLRRYYATNDWLHRRLAFHLWSLLNQSSRLSVCNLCHRIPERVSRWLLTLHDRAKMDDLNFTHERLAELLGVRRASVTIQLGVLAGMGAIRSGRRRVRIIDRDKLKMVSCECYKYLAEEYKLVHLQERGNEWAPRNGSAGSSELNPLRSENLNFKDPLAGPRSRRNGD